VGLVLRRHQHSVGENSSEGYQREGGDGGVVPGEGNQLRDPTMYASLAVNVGGGKGLGDRLKLEDRATLGKEPDRQGGTLREEI